MADQTIEMNLYLRGGQTVTVQVAEASILRAPLSGDFTGLKWTGVDDATALALREIRVEAVDAVTFRELPGDDAAPKEA